MEKSLPTTDSDSSLVGQLRGTLHDTLGDLVTDQQPAILDFPDIRNCGDSAIWLGEIAYLEQYHGVRPGYVSRMNDFSPEELEAAVPEAPIFIHGGGNFGDVWRGHQDFREHILERFPHRRVVQFPQSIHYESTERLETTKRVIAGHSHFVLLVRDVESRDLAERHFDCDVRLCPDMAFAIGSVTPSRTTLPVLAMLRKDRERVSDETPAIDGVPVEDWITESSRRVRIAKAVGAASAWARLSPADVRFRKLDAAAHNRFRRGIRQISRGEVIVTDRLHVHICSTLLGKPHAVLDNSYGKIRRFMDAFYGSTDLTYRATSLDDAVAWGREKAGVQTR